MQERMRAKVLKRKSRIRRDKMLAEEKKLPENYGHDHPGPRRKIRGLGKSRLTKKNVTAAKYARKAKRLKHKGSKSSYKAFIRSI